MKIATWNVERLKHRKSLDKILSAIEEAQALTGADPSFRGMEIYTYLNQTIQSEIDAIQRDERDIPFPDELMQTAMIAMDNRNGAIVGIGGGSQLVMVKQAVRRRDINDVYAFDVRREGLLCKVGSSIGERSR